MSQQMPTLSRSGRFSGRQAHSGLDGIQYIYSGSHIQQAVLMSCPEMILPPIMVLCLGFLLDGLEH